MGESPANALTPESGMLRTEILRTIDAAVLANKQDSLREIITVNEQLGQIRLHQQRADASLESLTTQQAVQGEKINTLVAGQLRIDAGQIEILRKIEAITSQQETVTEETADGVRVIKHFRNWGTVGGDLKKYWKQVAALCLAYKLFGGWFVEHGISWASIWGTHK